MRMPEVKMPEYPDNSDAAKAPVAVREEEHTGVVSGRVTRKKKSALKRASESMLANDAEDIKSYLVFDVLIPAAKDTLSDLVSKGLDMMLYTDSRGSNTRSRSSRRTGGYHNKYNQPERRERPQISQRDRRMLHFDDIILDNRGDAEQVLDYLRRRIDDYEVATVADFYDAVEVTSDYTDTKYGWYDLEDAYVRRVRDGFQIFLPRAEHIE